MSIKAVLALSLAILAPIQAMAACTEVTPRVITCSDGSWAAKVAAGPKGAVWRMFDGKGHQGMCGFYPSGKLAMCTPSSPVDGYYEH